MVVVVAALVEDEGVSSSRLVSGFGICDVEGPEAEVAVGSRYSDSASR